MGFSKVYRAAAIGFVAAALSVSVVSADEPHSMHYIIDQAGGEYTRAHPNGELANNKPEIASGKPTMSIDYVTQTPQAGPPIPPNPLFLHLRELAAAGRWTV